MTTTTTEYFMVLRNVGRSDRSLLEKAIKCPMLYGVTIVTRPRRKATKSSGREKIIVILFLVLIDF